MGKIDEKKQHKEERLLETAFSLFTSKGMSKTSVADIAASAGIAKGTFYLYFHDKYELGNKLIAHKSASLFRHAIATMNQSQAKTVEDQMIIIIDDLLNQLQANPILLRFINKNLSWGIFQNALNQTDAVSDISYKEYFTQMIRSQKDTIWIEPMLMLYTIVELVGSSCYSVILERNPVGLEQYKPFLYDSVRAIIRTHQRKRTSE